MNEHAKRRPRESIRLLVCGSRDWSDYNILANVLDRYPLATVLIEGGARGADTMALEYAIWRGWDWEEFPADWGRYHLGAGPIRNKEMIEIGHPQRVLAFHADLSQSKGTNNMVKQAIEAHIPVVLYDSEGRERRG